MKTTLNLVGAWRLTASYFVDQQTGQRCGEFEADVFGSAVFDPNGRMMALITTGARTKAESDSDRAALFKSMVAYTGTWSVDDEKLVTQVDGAWEPTWIGTAQVRYYAFDGQTLSLRTAPIQIPAFPGRDVIGYLDWRRDDVPRRQLT
jgi:Lipocalin-like domain